MRDGMFIIKTFSNETEAQFTLNHLLALDVNALIEKDNCGGMRPDLAVTMGVDLLVANEDREKALAVLETPVTDLAAEPWNCSGCGEKSEAGSDACWNCGLDK